MKLTTNLKNLTKSQLVLFLKESEERIKDESLLNEVVDALINAKKLKKEEIYQLANQVQTMLLAESIVENSTKQKEEPKKEELKKEEPKKAKKKKLTKKQQKDEPKKEEPLKEEKDEKKKEEKFKFPKNLTIDGVEYKINNRIKSVDSLRKILSQGKKVLFANVWLPEHLETYTYDIYNILDKKVEKFPDDLDLTVPVLISRNDKIIYTVSIYTDVMSVVLDEHLKERNAFGVEFRVYTD